MKNETNFWETKIGKILSHGIHEHNSGLGYIQNGKSLLMKEFKLAQEDELSEISFQILFDKNMATIRKGQDKCKESIDYIYKNLKEQNIKL